MVKYAQVAALSRQTVCPGGVGLPGLGKDAVCMKKSIVLILCLVLLCGTALADPVAFGGVSFDSTAEAIDLGDQIVTDWDGFVVFLHAFPDLKKVDMFATLIGRNEIDRLAETFPDIHFGWTMQMTPYHTVRTDATAFSTLHGWCDPHTSSELEILKYCTGMMALDLGHNNLTDLSFLLGMPHLRVLILAKNDYLGNNIEVLGELQELEYLELFGSGIRDVSILTKLPNLMDLNLAFNEVQDWRPLKEMKQLKRLWVSNLYGWRMPKEEQEELQEALPDTVIEFNGDPTDYGWREDPHYDIVYEIFHTGVYIPFAESAPLPEEEPQSR